MIRLLVLGFLALLTVAEVAAVVALVDWLGPSGALVVLTIDMLIGLLVIRWAALGPPKDRGFRLSAGAFIALPGLVLDLVGVALLIPAVRSWIRARVMRSTESALRRRGISVVTVTGPRDVVPGVVVVDGTDASDEQSRADAETSRPWEETDAGSPSGPAGQRGGFDRGRPSGPPVIRGEIVSGDIAGEATGEPPPATR